MTAINCHLVNILYSVIPIMLVNPLRTTYEQLGLFVIIASANLSISYLFFASTEHETKNSQQTLTYPTEYPVKSQ